MYAVLINTPIILFLQWVASIDLSPNEEAHANVIVTKTESWTEQNEEVHFFNLFMEVTELQ